MKRLSDKLFDLAQQLAYARGVKDAAKVRSQCTLEEWYLVLAEAKKIYQQSPIAQRQSARALLIPR